MVKPLKPTLGIRPDEREALLWLSRGWKLEAALFPALPALQRKGMAVFKARINRFEVTKAGRRLAAQLREVPR